MIRQWALPSQQKAIDAMLLHGSVAAAAESLGITPSRLRGALSEARRRAAKAGYSPAHDMVHTVPDGFHVKGVSSYYGKNGKLRGQWVKSNKDEEHRIAQLLDGMQQVAEKWEGMGGIAPPPQHADDDLLVVIPWGDPHIGLFAWAEETGDRDYDLSLAEKAHCQAVDHLVSISPPAAQGLLISVGDLSHADNPQNRTTRSGHTLDVDTRYPKVYRVILHTLVWSVRRMLEKYKRVRVISAPGNHDDVTAYTVAVCLAAWFREDPRVTVDLTPSKSYWYRHGKCLLGVTHGDTMKPERMGQVMAADRAVDWGETLWRHIYSGHLHHDRLLELPGVTVETIRTLAARDSFAAAGGWRALQDMKMDVWHKNHGKLLRHTVGIERLL